MIALVCPWCGAPLPRLAAGQSLVTCAYCNATASLAGERVTKAQPGARTGAPADPQRVIAAFQGARARGASPYDALVVTARERLGSMGETDTFARVVLALARDFDAENKTQVVDDPMCMGRLIEIYLKAIDAVRSEGSFQINLPFFTATSEGPAHLSIALTAERIAELAARDPRQEPKKKKGFWPFG